MHAKKTPLSKSLENLHITYAHCLMVYKAMCWEFKEQMSKNIIYVKMSLHTGLKSRLGSVSNNDTLPYEESVFCLPVKMIRVVPFRGWIWAKSKCLYCAFTGKRENLLLSPKVVATSSMPTAVLNLGCSEEGDLIQRKTAQLWTV